MSNRAWMPLHPTEFLSETFWLTAEEIGGFTRLLIHLWQHGNLPDDESEWLDIAGFDDVKWNEAGRNIFAMFQIDDRDGTSPADRILHGAERSRPAIPLDIRRRVKERDGLLCVYCGDYEGPFEFDHRHPVSRGGRNTIENVCMACRQCNRSKGALTAEEFIGLSQ